MIRKIIASIALLVSASCVFAADDVLTDLTTSRLPSGGVYRVTTDGTNATLTVNQIATTAQIISTSTILSNAALKVFSYTNVTTDLKVNGDITIGAQNGFTGVVTNKMVGYTNFLWIGEGVITNVSLTGALP